MDRPCTTAQAHRNNVEPPHLITQGAAPRPVRIPTYTQILSIQWRCLMPRWLASESVQSQDFLTLRPHRCRIQVQVILQEVAAGRDRELGAAVAVSTAFMTGFLETYT